jgi:hypothetical protein
MKDLKEIYRALADGKTLVKGYNTLVSSIGSRITIDNANGFMFKNPSDWIILEEEPKYCRFKRLASKKTCTQPSENAYQVDSKDYNDFIKAGWVPMEAKTFEEIE